MVQRDSILHGVVGEVHGDIVDANGVSDEMKGSTECNAMQCFQIRAPKTRTMRLRQIFFFGLWNGSGVLNAIIGYDRCRRSSATDVEVTLL